MTGFATPTVRTNPDSASHGVAQILVAIHRRHVPCQLLSSGHYFPVGPPYAIISPALRMMMYRMDKNYNQFLRKRLMLFSSRNRGDRAKYGKLSFSVYAHPSIHRPTARPPKSTFLIRVHSTALARASLHALHGGVWRWSRNIPGLERCSRHEALGTC